MNQPKKVNNQSIYWDLPYKCSKCDSRFETQVLMQRHARTHILTERLDTIIYRGRVIRFDYNVKTGICAKCGSKKGTHLHHIVYHDDDPLKDTLELCPSCHGKWHRDNTDGWGELKAKLWNRPRDQNGQITEISPLQALK